MFLFARDLFFDSKMDKIFKSHKTVNADKTYKTSQTDKIYKTDKTGKIYKTSKTDIIYKKLNKLFLISIWTFSLTVSPPSIATQMDAQQIKPNNHHLKVITSISPFYLLASAIMEGVESPILLVKPGASPHDYHLKPSEVNTLSNADLIIWGGPELETFLMTPIKNLSTNVKIHVLELVKTPGLKFLEVRSEFANQPDEHGHNYPGAIDNNTPDNIHNQPHIHNHPHDSHTHTHEIQTNRDMHFWLDPKHAPLLADQVASKLSELDPINANIYKKNGENFKQKMKVAETKIAKKMQPIKTIPYLVFHDAYRYFEKHYGLNSIGAVTLHPELPPSAKRLLTMQALIKKENVRCVFTEPQFPDKMVKNLINGTRVGTATLDPLGTLYLNEENGYIKMFDGIANSMEFCLKNSII